MKSDLLDIEMVIHAEPLNGKAIKASDDGDPDHAVWLPKSQIEIERKVDNVVIITMPEWLAIEKGLV